MSEEVVQQIKERMSMDRVFRHDLFASPLHILQEYPLTEEEKHLFVVPNFSRMIEKSQNATGGRFCGDPRRAAHSGGTTSCANAWPVVYAWRCPFPASVIMHEACLLLFLHRYNRVRAILLK